MCYKNCTKKAQKENKLILCPIDFLSTQGVCGIVVGEDTGHIAWLIRNRFGTMLITMCYKNCTKKAQKENKLILCPIHFLSTQGVCGIVVGEDKGHSMA